MQKMSEFNDEMERNKKFGITTTILTMKYVTTILAIKDFQTASMCFLCKSTSPAEEKTTTTYCPSCGGSFLTILTGVSNECSVMLANRKWYTANGSVSIALWFSWLIDYLWLNQLKNFVF